MIEKIKQELIENDESYIILNNGEIIASSSDQLSLEFNNDVNLKIVHIFTKDTKIIYRIRENTNIRISEVFYNLENSPKVEIEMNLEENSKLNYLSLRRTTNQEDIKAIINANIHKNAYLNYKTLTTYLGDGQINEKFYLHDADAKCDVKNVLINSSSKTQNFYINIYHNSPNTISNLLNFGIANNNSTLKIDSTGIIKQGCHKAEIRQKAKGLILDLTSTLSANPLLEIDDFDVIANHGASIGAIDEEELYYLMSRGLSREDSEKLIINGFINPFYLEIKEGKFQDYIKTWVNLNV